MFEAVAEMVRVEGVSEGEDQCAYTPARATRELLCRSGDRPTMKSISSNGVEAVRL
jgi:hypothetical protein